MSSRLSDVRQRYNSLEEIWPKDDFWHWETRQGLQSTLSRFVKKHKISSRIALLDAGGGDGTTFSIASPLRVNMDIAEKKLCNDACAAPVCGNIEGMPFANGAFDVVLCLGSVINYTNILSSFIELSRVLSKGGYLIVDIETSNSAEYLFTKHWRKSIAMTRPVYQGCEEPIWVYSFKNVKDTVAAVDLALLDVSYIHIISSLAGLLVSDEIASKFRKFDALAGRIPVIRSFASNSIICCRKM